LLGISWEKQGYDQTVIIINLLPVRRIRVHKKQFAKQGRDSDNVFSKKLTIALMLGMRMLKQNAIYTPVLVDLSIVIIKTVI